MIGMKQNRFGSTHSLVASTWVVIVGTISSSTYASIDDVPSPYRRDVQCMMNVLKGTPRVDQVESGALLDNGSMRPFVQYHYLELDGHAGTVRFVSDTSKYRALLDGLMTPGGQRPPAFGTAEIVKHWELECGVQAVAVFV
jgi:hypothetical protein